MTLKTKCVPQPSVFASDRRATVLSLDTFLKGQIQGKPFFDENYFTVGMSTLVDRAFRQLAGERYRIQATNDCTQCTSVSRKRTATTDWSGSPSAFQLIERR